MQQEKLPRRHFNKQQTEQLPPATLLPPPNLTQQQLHNKLSHNLRSQLKHKIRKQRISKQWDLHSLDGQ